MTDSDVSAPDGSTNRWSLKENHKMWINKFVKNHLTNSTTNWMYSAVNQASMNGTEPLWTRDGWNFVPLDVSSLELRLLTPGQNRTANDHVCFHKLDV